MILGDPAYSRKQSAYFKGSCIPLLIGDFNALQALVGVELCHPAVEHKLDVWALFELLYGRQLAPEFAQVGILDGQYILHGRAGENEAGSGAFVFYTSADGILWDGGKILVDGRPACFYSNNLTIRCPDGKERMLVQYSENYNDPQPGVWTAQCNTMHLWLESL